MQLLGKSRKGELRRAPFLGLVYAAVPSLVFLIYIFIPCTTSSNENGRVLWTQRTFILNKVPASGADADEANLVYEETKHLLSAYKQTIDLDLPYCGTAPAAYFTSISIVGLEGPSQQNAIAKQLQQFRDTKRLKPFEVSFYKYSGPRQRPLFLVKQAI